MYQFGKHFFLFYEPGDLNPDRILKNSRFFVLWHFQWFSRIVQFPFIEFKQCSFSQAILKNVVKWHFIYFFLTNLAVAVETFVTIQNGHSKSDAVMGNCGIHIC